MSRITSKAIRMRVDFVITELYPGGAERCLTELAIGLARRNVAVRVFSLGRLPEGDRAGLVRRLYEEGITVDAGQTDSVFGMPSTLRRLKGWLRSSPPDVCQTFLHHANVLGTFAAKSSGVSVRVGGVRVAETRPIRDLIERAAIRRMQHLVCVSAAVREFAERRLCCDRDRLAVIGNGVDVDRFASASPMDWSQIGWPRDSIVSLFVGRLHPQKGIELLQRQVEHLAPEHSNRRLLLVGDGPLGDEIDRWASSVGSDRVKRLPWQSDVAPLLRAARVLILPSRYEGMANVVLEAMSAGRPVVCSRVEGSEELLADAIDTQGFAAGDGVAMIQLAERFLEDESLSDSVGRENQTRVRRDFSLPAMIDAYESLYRRLLETRRRDD